MAQAKQNSQRNGPHDAGAPPETDAEALLDSLRRERADFLNYKRRVDQERSEDRGRTQKELILCLLPVLDELDRALGQIPDDLKTHPWVQGVALSRQRLGAALRELGVERIGAEGEPFDPSLHEALFHDARRDAVDQRVASVIRPGYRLGDHVLRAAQVSVVGPPERRAPPADEAEEIGADHRPVGPPPERRDAQPGG